MPAAKIILGVSGSIAACKCPDLVRQLVAEGCEIQTVLTETAAAFVGPHALAALSGRRVRDDLWDAESEMSMGHIELARWADLVLIAPASAHLISRLACGIADDLLTCLYLATPAPVLLAPAMNQGMWLHPSTQRNVRQVRTDGVRLLGPLEGDQACGDVGPGRMMEPEAIVRETIEFLSKDRGCLSGKKVLVTAGPTREAIDPVRYLSNASSGRQGFAVADASARAGAEVAVISGPVSLPTPSGVERIDVNSASQMKTEVLKRAADADILFAVAAVADFRAATQESQKIKKHEHTVSSAWILALEPTEDIVEAVASLDRRPFLVGFAAETQDVLEHAREKRKHKGLDAIVVNDVSDQSIGFDSSENQVTLIHEDGEEFFARAPKTEIAGRLVRRIAELYTSRLGPS